MGIYNTTRWVANEQPVQSRKFTNWDRKLQDSVQLSQLCIREARGDYGVIQYGSNFNLDRVYWYDDTDGSYTNRTTPVRYIDQSNLTEGTPIFGAPPQQFGNNDILYLGFKNHFNGLTYYLNVQGTGGTATYKYWHSILGSWMTFNPTSSSNANNFYLSGVQNITWTLDLLPSWGATSLTDAVGETVDSKSLYWIQITLAGYTVYPRFYILSTNRTILDMYTYPSYIDDGAERAVFVAPGQVVINGVIYELSSPVKLNVDTVFTSQPYYGAVVVNYDGIMSIQTYSMDTCPPVEVVADAESVKLSDILLSGTGGIETSDITDVRLMLT